MNVLGKPGQVTKISAFVDGGKGNKDIPVAGFSITNTVGAIPTCSVIVPIEFIGNISTQDSDGNDIQYQLKIGDGGGSAYTIFVGSYTGDGHEITGNSCGAQISLIHPAHQIDVGQIVASGLCSSSSVDFENIIKTKGYTTGVSNNPHLIDFYKGGNLIEDFKAGLAQAMQDTSSETTGPEGNVNSNAASQAAIKAVSAILSPYGGTISAGVSGEITASINDYLQRIVGSSLTGRTSMWDVLCSVFSTFGIYLVCNNETGLVYALPDVSAMRPPGGNLITGGLEVTGARASSSIIRDIGQVTLFSGAMQNESTAQDGPQVAFVSYPASKKSGTELGLSMPAWLNPIAQPLAAADLKEVQTNLAKAYYYIEKNKMKTAAISTALAPEALPGTMVMVAPYSSMKPLAGLGASAIERRYVGYLYQVSHTCDMASKQIYTVFSLRNYVPEDEADFIPSNALFDDAVCPTLL